MSHQIFHFQVTTSTELEAEAFMNAVAAQDIVIEEWTYTSVETDHESTEVYGFGVTKYMPGQLSHIARQHGIDLVYVESEQQQEQRFQSVMQKVTELLEHSK